MCCNSFSKIVHVVFSLIYTFICVCVCLNACLFLKKKKTKTTFQLLTSYFVLIFRWVVIYAW